MITDLEIERRVIEELNWEPSLDASKIGVAVNNGIVTLSGRVGTYANKITAEQTVKRVAGVKALVEEMESGFSYMLQPTDEEIARAVLDTLKWHCEIPENTIRVKVEHGAVNLEGQVEWGYQRMVTEKAVGNLTGVKQVYNYITIKPRIAAADLKDRISGALLRSATVDASKILVEVQGNKAILQGAVRSFAEKEDAEKAAWAAPGITEVESHLVIESPYAFTPDELL